MCDKKDKLKKDPRSRLYYREKTKEECEAQREFYKYFSRESDIVVAIEECNHEWGIDGAHSNEYCKKCFISKEEMIIEKHSDHTH